MDATASGSHNYTFIFLCVTYFPESDNVLYIANLIAANKTYLLKRIELYTL